MAITLASGINATQENVTLSAALDAVPGDLFRLGSEVVQFGGYGRIGRLPDHSHKRVIFHRGIDTAAAAHLSGVTLLGVADALVASADEDPPNPFPAGGAGGVTIGDGVTTVEATSVLFPSGAVTDEGAGVAGVAGLTNPLVSPLQINVAVDDDEYLLLITAPEGYDEGFGEVIQVQNFIEDTIFGLNVFGQIVLGSSAAPKVSLNDNLIGSMAITTGSEGAAYLRATSTGVTVFTVLGSGAVVTGANVAPGDSEIAAGQVALWFDDTNGAAKLMLKGKSANGTIVTGEVALA